MPMEGFLGTLFLVILSTAVASANRVECSVDCTEREMIVRVNARGVQNVELDKYGEVPGCAATLQGTYYIFTLPLDDRRVCGINKFSNKISGETVYYHKIAVTSGQRTSVKLVKCEIKPDYSTLDNIVKRDVLPPGFEEPDYIEITSEVSGTAPIPMLGVGVKQDGDLVGGQIEVRPGTPLTMEVFLDDLSAGTYGILMSYMEVTDTQNKRETVIFNGCSVDPVLFDNFITTNGDYVSAKFRAFKFPETNYVFFRGTVDVCLDKCQWIACSNGQLGFGRRRRGVDSQPADPNKIFEVTMTTYFKVDETLNDTRKSILTIEEDVIGTERMTKEVTQDLTKSMVDRVLAVERAVESTDDALTWGSSADYFTPVKPNPGNEPAFIYFNDASRMVSNFCLSLVGLLVILIH